MEPLARGEMIKMAGVAGGGILLAAQQARADQFGGNTSSNPQEAGKKRHDGAQLGQTNPGLDAQNRDSVEPPTSDHGNVDPVQIPFRVRAHKSLGSGLGAAGEDEGPSHLARSGGSEPSRRAA